MKNSPLLWSLLVIILFISCGTSEDCEEIPEPEDPALVVQIKTNTATPFIDYILEVEITTSNPIQEIEVTDDGNVSNSAKSSGEPNGLGTSVKLYFSYTTLGPRKLDFLVTDIYGQIVPFSETITVTRGNAVRILSAEVISFYRMNETWDPEFTDTDINRLADVAIALHRSKLNDRFGGTDYSTYRWFTSDSYPNQSNLFFDFSAEELYIDLNKQIRVGIGDDDGGNMGQSLFPDFPDYRILDLKEYNMIRPSEIILKDESVNFEIKFRVEWPQN